MNDVSVESYKPSDDEPFMNDRQTRVFPPQADRLARIDSGREPRHAGRPAAGKRKPPRLRRPSVFGNRPRDRAARPRPPAQTDRQDRGRAGPHRRRLLRLLRRDRRSHLAQAPRRASDRDSVGRGAGAPRTARADLSRRVIRRPVTATTRVDSSACAPSSRLRKGRSSARLRDGASSTTIDRRNAADRVNRTFRGRADAPSPPRANRGRRKDRRLWRRLAARRGVRLVPWRAGVGCFLRPVGRRRRRGRLRRRPRLGQGRAGRRRRRSLLTPQAAPFSPLRRLDSAFEPRPPAPVSPGGAAAQARQETGPGDCPGLSRAPFPWREPAPRGSARRWRG